MKSVALTSLIVCLQMLAIAQQECRTLSYKEHLVSQSPQLTAKILAIENFTQNWIQKQKISVNGVHSPDNDLTVITIPVVVHVVYNSFAQNISDAQILSQLDVLNHDFRHQNGDSVNTPDIFKPFAADCGIRFVLAKVDPMGRATSGIIRKHTNTISFDLNDHIKSSATGGDDAWDAASYLNIWVGNLSFGILGYASIPGCDKIIDGVAIQYSAFGSVGLLSAPYDKGRTATHEIGHWLNLIHTWGDTNCGDDLVDDTPPQKGPNRACPGAVRVTCGSGPYGDMYMNYMDFTNDACLNMFSDGQRERMRSLFAPGGVRNSLLNSTAASIDAGNTVVESVPTPDHHGASLRVYPNPAVTLVSIQMADSLTGPLNLYIYNSMGQIVMTSLLVQQLQQVDVSQLPRGVYYIKADDGKRRNIARMMKL